MRLVWRLPGWQCWAPATAAASCVPAAPVQASPPSRALCISPCHGVDACHGIFICHNIALLSYMGQASIPGAHCQPDCTNLHIVPEPWGGALACVPLASSAGSERGFCAAGAKQRSEESRGKRRWQSFGGARGEALSAAVSDQSALDKGKGVARGPATSGVLQTLSPAPCEPHADLV